MRDVFVRLARLDDRRPPTAGEWRDTRRRVALEELVPAGGRREATKQGRLVSAAGGTARGLVAGHRRNGRPAGTTVEVAHEALIRDWPRLRGWLEARPGRAARLRQEVGDAARIWEEHGRVDGFLAHDESPRFEAVDALDREGPLPLSRLERAYVEACRVARVRRRVAEVAESARQKMRNVALRSRVHAAAGAMGSGLGYGAAFGVAYWREVAPDWWAAQVYAAAWFPLGVVFGLAVGIAQLLFPRPPLAESPRPSPSVASLPARFTSSPVAGRRSRALRSNRSSSLPVR